MAINLEQFESYRLLLFSIAYQMLGSAMEAEDIVQETFLRLEKLEDQHIQNPKAYLCTITTRLCLDQLKSARVQRESYVGTWLPEPVLTSELLSDVMSRKEDISVAFLVLLERLSPIERAIFLLRDVFNYSYVEIAPIVDKSEANCRRYYRLAKQFLLEHRPRFEASAEEQKKLTESFLHAITTGDAEGLTRLLAEDVILYGDGGGKAPAVKRPLHGREEVLRLLLGISRLLTANAVRIAIADVNGNLALLFWLEDVLYFVINLAVADGQIKAIYNVLNPDKLQYVHNRYAASTKTSDGT